MSTWDEEYFNMEVQTFISATSNNLGTFQFALAQENVDGTFDATEQNYHFSWMGYDEMDESEGDGWIALDRKAAADTAHGELSFESSDSSTFKAK